MNIVITGSTKGIGLGMARAFVERGHNVVVSSRSADAVAKAVRDLNELSAGHAAGIAADVGNIDDVRKLWQHATEAYGDVDIWINNAGVTNRKLDIHEIPDDQLRAVSNTNVLGLLNCCKVALGGMLAQGKGKLLNMEGFGSDGITKPGMSAYGSSKRALHYLTKALVQEYKATPLIIGSLSPGIVVTDLLMKDLNDAQSDEFKKRTGLLNIVADRVETVAPFLADGALKLDKSGGAVRWMTIWQLLGRFIKAPFTKRDVIGSFESASS